MPKKVPGEATGEKPAGIARKLKAEAGKAPRKKREPAQKAAEKPAAAEPEKPKVEILAVVRVRGLVGVKKDTASTLVMLRLDRINHCVLVPKNRNFRGMLEKARHFITWGEISKDTLEKLVSKRGRFAGDKRVTDQNYAKELAGLILSGKPVKETGIKPVFRLSPPSKGYRSTKMLYPKGSLGYRGVKINELLKRMI